MKFSFVSSLVALAATCLAADVDSTSIKATLTSTTSVKVASGCSFKDTYTATAQSDLDKLASCEAVQGDIFIGGTFGSAAIANVKVIYGDLQVNSTDLIALTGDSLTTITGTLKLQGLTVLSTLSFANLASVGAIEWVTLPALVSTGLTSVTECNSIYISDTLLSSLDGLNPTDVEIFNINNNLNLDSISSNIETVSNALTIAFNGDNTEVEFDDLKWANNITFYSVASVSMSSLETVNKSAGFFKNGVSSLEFPLITSIGADLTIENNNDLNYIDFGNVTTIGGGLVIVNNTELLALDNLDNIKSVQGAVNLKGDFDNVTMSSLRTVRGAFELETTGTADCSPFESLSKKGSIQGSFVCKAAAKKVSSSSSTGTKTKTSTQTSESTTGTVSSISSTSKGDAAGLKASVFGTIAAVMLALF